MEIAPPSGPSGPDSEEPAPIPPRPVRPAVLAAEEEPRWHGRPVRAMTDAEIAAAKWQIATDESDPSADQDANSDPASPHGRYTGKIMGVPIGEVTAIRASWFDLAWPFRTDQIAFDIGLDLSAQVRGADAEDQPPADLPR